MAGAAIVLSFWDYNKESSAVRIPISDGDGLWEEGQDELDTLRAAINGITLGVMWKESRIFMDEQLAGVPPNNPTAQREIKWLVRMTEADTWRKLTFEVPCADPALLSTVDRGKMNIATGAGATFKTEVEGAYLSDRGKSVTVDEVVLVGRNV